MSLPGGLYTLSVRLLHVVVFIRGSLMFLYLVVDIKDSCLMQIKIDLNLNFFRKCSVPVSDVTICTYRINYFIYLEHRVVDCEQNPFGGTVHCFVMQCEQLKVLCSNIFSNLTGITIWMLVTLAREC